MNEVLIDADSLIYKAGCANEDRAYVVYEIDSGAPLFETKYKADLDAWWAVARESDKDVDEWAAWHKVKYAGPVSHSIANLKNAITSIVDELRLPYTVFYGGSATPRKALYPDYKLTRDPLAKPIHYPELCDYLRSKFGAVYVQDWETDDEVAMRATSNPQAIIASIDKDLLTVPGWHYNFDKRTLFHVTDVEAFRYFCKQILSGDYSDNVPGLAGVGDKRAEALLSSCKTKDELLLATWAAYKNKGMTYDYFLMNAQLLHMKRTPTDVYIPHLNLE